MAIKKKIEDLKGYLTMGYIYKKGKEMIIIYLDIDEDDQLYNREPDKKEMKEIDNYLLSRR